jgi:hypothetical protein
MPPAAFFASALWAARSRVASPSASLPPWPIAAKAEPDIRPPAVKGSSSISAPSPRACVQGLLGSMPNCCCMSSAPEGGRPSAPHIAWRG